MNISEKLKIAIDALTRMSGGFDPNTDFEPYACREDYDGDIEGLCNGQTDEAFEIGYEAAEYTIAKNAYDALKEMGEIE